VSAPAADLGPPRDLAVELAHALRGEVAPELGRHSGREHAGAGAGGDVTFAIDERAEAFMEAFLADRAPQVAFYSEDRGLVSPGGGAEWVLVVDPIDGTRPAMAGFEAACVSVALAPLGEGDPTIADVQVGCIVEIKSGRAFVAERGRGVEPPPALAANTEIPRMFWAYGLRGRPVRRVAEVLGDLVDASSVGGGTFDLGSATYDMTRVVTGQLDAYIEPGSRMIAEIPGIREEFERIGAGAVLNNSPYDLAAAVLICEEAGAIVTDASGAPLGPRKILGSGAEFQLSCVTACTPELHARIVQELDAGIQRLSRTMG
jgi:myo-inositol-1(or 4)-monophosphatase